MALIRGSKVERIYPISSGKPSTPTILGTFKVYSKTPGTNAKGMVFTSYFRGGYGIHGYAEVPIYPASHGCLRTPVPDAVSIFRWISYGDAVDVYRVGLQLGGRLGGQVAPAPPRMPPRAKAARWRSAPAPSASMRSTPPARRRTRALARRAAPAPSPRGRSPARAAARRRAAASRAARRARRGSSTPSAPRAATSRAVARGSSAAARASPWISPARPATVAQRGLASIARTSTVPRCGCGRMSHHRNV